jgi:uncharacterized membrane protein YqjE
MTAPPVRGPLDSVRTLGSTLVALLRVRVELIAIELKEEAERRKRLAMRALVAVLFLACGLLFAAFFVVAFFWDTYRLAAIAGVTLVYLGVGAWAILSCRSILSAGPPAFAATLQEFENDLDMLQGRDEQSR